MECIILAASGILTMQPAEMVFWCRIIEGSTTMEIVSHGAHMHEMLWDIGNEYKRIKANPPKAGMVAASISKILKRTLYLKKTDSVFVQYAVLLFIIYLRDRFYPLALEI